MSEDRSALLTALVTEHSVQQSIASSTIGEASGRASLYMTSLSSTLIALGFLSGTAGFGPFVGAAFPVVLILGWFTIARLIDTSIQAIVASERVNTIRAYYTTLTEDAAQFFPGAGQVAGRDTTEVALAHTRLAPFLTTAMMIGTVNAVLAGASVGLAVTGGFGASLTVGVIGGIVIAIAAVGAAFRYQQSRFTNAFPGA